MHSATFFARPIPSVRTPVCLSVTSRSTVKTVIDSPMVTTGAHWKSAPGYSGEPSPTPYDHPFLQTGGPQPPLKTCIANCGHMMPDTKVVCIDSLWEHIIALPIGAPLQKCGSQKHAEHLPHCRVSILSCYNLVHNLLALTNLKVCHPEGKHCSVACYNTHSLTSGPSSMTVGDCR